MPYKLFLSYTREKDAYNFVSNFKKRLQLELKIKTGDKHLEIFQDTEIVFGTDWALKLQSELDNTNCLIILLSPLWPNSEECNKEYFHYCRKKISGNNSRLIIPILFDEILDSDILDNEKRSIYAELKKLNMPDWSDLKYKSYGSTSFKKGVSNLAKHIKSMLANN